MATKPSLRLSMTLPWSQWTAEAESVFAQLAKDVARDFGHRPRWQEARWRPGSDWEAVALISARGGREAEAMRRLAKSLAATRGLKVEALV